MKKRVYGCAASISALALILTSSSAFAAPVTDDDIRGSKAAEETAKMSIADAELELARLAGESTRLEQEAAAAQVENIRAQAQLSDAIASAIASQGKANKAREDVDHAKNQLGSISQAMYKDSAANITSSFYLLGADTFHEANKRNRAFDAIANQADNKVKHFAALEEIAKVLQNKADKAAKDQIAVADGVAQAEQKSNAIAQKAQQQVAMAKARRSELVTVLAHQRGTSEALEAQRLADIEADRAARSEAAAAALVAGANADRFREAAELAQKNSQEANASLASVKANLAEAEKSGNQSAIALAKEAVDKAQKASETLAANQKIVEERAAAERAAAERAEAERRAKEARERAEAERARQEAARKAAEEQAAREREAAAAAAQRPAPAPAPAPARTSRNIGQQLVDFGRQYLGVPYVWGGSTTAGWDCSGFMQFIFNHHGYNVPRVSNQYAHQGYRQVSPSEALPGDVVLWPGHVGMYSGNGMHIAAYNPAMGTQEGPVYGSPIYLRVAE